MKNQPQINEIGIFSLFLDLLLMKICSKKLQKMTICKNTIKKHEKSKIKTIATTILYKKLAIIIKIHFYILYSFVICYYNNYRRKV